MTKHDEKLIEKANHLFCTEWYMVSKMAKEADSEETKELLQNKAKRMNHDEEYFAGIL
jgi:hypothetical protein